ncbi:unnamed protein product [Mytilus coruscus]|uniref:Ig-like domain-containing protein n=1 Tax=Mytilus coruscus TaxID=42192 RepID=A0A6J8B8B2_MYTCO|nr:unnamed protein product [Mytilus coruscus]
MMLFSGNKHEQGVCFLYPFKRCLRLTLNVQPEIIRINQNINITCTVHGIDIINSNLTRQWSKGPDLICYNGHPIDSSKYTEVLTSGNQFKLQIKNISESDVNYKYQCRYGFEAQAKNIESSKDNFEYPPANEVRAIIHTNESVRLLTVNLHFKKIFPLPTCTAVIEGLSLPFNITSSKSFGNYYEVILRHQSIDKLHCNGEVVVKCKLIKEYIIPTKDLRKCSFEELVISKCYKLKLPCLAIHEKERSTSSSLSSNYSDQFEVCLRSEDDKEINSKNQITAKLMNNSEDQKDFGNMDLVVSVSCLSTGNIKDTCDCP